MTSIGSLIKKISKDFENGNLYFGHGSESAWDEAVFLVLSVLKLPLDSDRSITRLPVSPEQEEEILEFARRRLQEKVPLPHLLKCAYFAGLPFYVDERVLIPRSSFGELILKQFFPWLPRIPRRILDLCTGSGCMAIAAAMEFPEAEIVASDLSTEALQVAEINLASYDCQHRIRLVQSDLFKNISGQFDLIISNPPYVDRQDFQNLPEEYRHEPALALESGEDGLFHTREILKQAAQFLHPKGLLFVEVGNSEVALEAAYPELPFTWIEFEHGDSGIFMLTREQLVSSNDV